EVVAVETHGRTTTRYALAQPKEASKEGRAALVLLPGGGGHLDLDGKGCVRALKGNFLVRSLALFHGAGFSTALVDAPSDHPGEDGLRGFRIAPQHADDLGKVIADVRRRAQAPVWVVGTSRGTISAANAAARLAGPHAPDGVVLTSAITSGGSGGRRPWAAQTVFDLRLEAIAAPVLGAGPGRRPGRGSLPAPARRPDGPDHGAHQWRARAGGDGQWRPGRALRRS